MHRRSTMPGMFTGIVETKGTIVEIQPQPTGHRLLVDRGSWPTRAGRIERGDSIAVMGVCLTVASLENQLLGFDVIPETLSMTKLGSLRVGDAVNLESALTATTPMGGHTVQGHVDGVGTVVLADQQEGETRIAIEPPADLLAYIIPKGSITIDGVSLTIANVAMPKANQQAGRFEIALIPTTLQFTTLGQLQAGDPVNIETDILARTIVHTLRQMAAGPAADQDAGAVTMDVLQKAGFTA